MSTLVRERNELFKNYSEADLKIDIIRTRNVNSFRELKKILYTINGSVLRGDTVVFNSFKNKLIELFENFKQSNLCYTHENRLDLERKKNNIEASIKIQSSSINGVQESLDKMERELPEFQSLYEGICLEVEKLTKELDSLKDDEEIAKISNEISLLMSDKGKTSETITSLEGAILRSKQSLLTYKNELEKKNQQLSEIKKKLKEEE